MSKLLACFSLASMLGMGLVGCAEKTEVKEEKKVSTPGGTTTTTESTTNEKTGDAK
jgi:hypothetical protein